MLVWLSVLPQAPGQPMIVALAMAGVSAVVTRRLLVGDGESSEQTTHRTPTGGAPVIGWIDEDREGVLAA